MYTVCTDSFLVLKPVNFFVLFLPVVFLFIKLQTCGESLQRVRTECGMAIVRTRRVEYWNFVMAFLG